MIQRSLFDLPEAEAERDAGKERAAGNRETILDHARELAVEIAGLRLSREVSADDVYRALVLDGFDVEELGAAAGSLFAGDLWEFTGRWVRSSRVSNHARAIRVWRLK